MSFRATALRLAASVGKAPFPSEAAEAASQLLPPLPLYRRLLRVHRKVLPIEMRVMGDEYIKVSVPLPQSATTSSRRSKSQFATDLLMLSLLVMSRLNSVEHGLPTTLCTSLGS